MPIQIAANVLTSAASLFILALSFNLIYATWKTFHFAHAATITLGAYGALVLASATGMSLWTVVPMSSAIVALVVSVICAPLYLVLKKGEVPAWGVLVAGIGLYTVFLNAIILYWGADSYTVRTWPIVVGRNVAGARISDQQLIIVGVSGALLLAVAFFVHFTRLGRELRALVIDPDLARVWGVPVSRLLLLTFLTGSFLGALGGALVATTLDFDSSLGLNPFIYAFVAIILGGKGLVWGPARGSLALSALQHVGAFALGSQWMSALAYAAMLVWFARYSTDHHELRAA
jgi:branched-chain amino acid transport system permease protein